MARALPFVALLACAGEPSHEVETRAPEFPAAAERWLGGPPATLATLRGTGVLVEAWSRH